MRKCEMCGRSIVAKNAQARYCSTRCRVSAHRATIPNELTNRDRWVRYTANKVPRTIDGQNASSTNPNTWTSYANAKTSSEGVGLGFVLGDGIGCIDLDHCLIGGMPTDIALEFLRGYPKHHIEISPSGEGLHIWGTSSESAGSRRNEGGLNVERYSTGRYITVTGRIYQRGQLLPL